MQNQEAADIALAVAMLAWAGEVFRRNLEAMPPEQREDMLVRADALTDQAGKLNAILDARIKAQEIHARKVSSRKHFGPGEVR